jgi:hypothetical protein
MAMPKNPRGIKTLLAFVIPRVFQCHCRPVRYLLGLLKIKAMFTKLLARLDSCHVKFIGYNYAYDYMYCQYVVK